MDNIVNDTVDAAAAEKLSVGTGCSCSRSLWAYTECAVELITALRGHATVILAIDATPDRTRAVYTRSEAGGLLFAPDLIRGLRTAHGCESDRLDV